MCITCGCAATPAPEAGEVAHWHQHADGSWHAHTHAPDVAAAGHEHDHGHDHDDAHAHHTHHTHEGRDAPATAPACGAALDADPGARRVQVERDVLAKNDAVAGKNRARLVAAGSLALNFVSSPGSGKTTLLCRTIEAIGNAFPVVVIEGDQQTTIDADRIRATGAPALQINTGKACHLDAAMVAQALAKLDPPGQALVMIENVGNLVCPAAFDLGEDAKVVVLSVTEGDDKPLKYPDMFAAAQLMLVNKTDLQPYCDFDPAQALAFARRVNPAIEMIALSARDGSGFGAWLNWIERRRAARVATAGRAPALVTR